MVAYFFAKNRPNTQDFYIQSPLFAQIIIAQARVGML